MRLTPRPYQIAGRDFLASRRHALLADEMRVGKTPQAIMAAHKIGARRVLVVCPAIACRQWKQEWERWSEALNKDVPEVEVISYNRATIDLPAYSSFRWDVLIPDEAHFAKTPTAQRTHAIYGKNGLGWCAEYVWPLTGTPAPNHAGEMWPMLRAFGVVKCGYEEFLYHYCYYNERQGRVYGNRASKLPELRQIIAPVMLRRKRREVAPDMKEIEFHMLNVDPVKGVDLKSETPELVDTQDRIAVARAKVPELVQEIKGALDGHLYEQTVVFAYHLDPIRDLRDALTGQGISADIITGQTPMVTRGVMLNEFRDKKRQVIIAQILAAGTAIDLSAARHGYMLELDYVPGNNLQAASRLVSMDKPDAVTIDVVNWPGTKDDSVQRTLLRKVDTAVFS
jgi:SNF2 family DNA or RNA helicase